jgi:hypothetical protein
MALHIVRQQGAVGVHTANVVSIRPMEVHAHSIGQRRTSKNCCDGEEKKNNSTTAEMLHPAGALYKDNSTLVLSNSSANLSCCKVYELGLLITRA